MTVPPETILEVSELLPPRPADAPLPAQSEEPPTSDSTANGSLQPASLGSRLPQLGARVDASLRPKETDVWDWAGMEQERSHGMKIADCMAGLDAVQDGFTHDFPRPALGRF